MDSKELVEEWKRAVEYKENCSHKKDWKICMHFISAMENLMIGKDINQQVDDMYDAVIDESDRPLHFSKQERDFSSQFIEHISNELKSRDESSSSSAQNRTKKTNSVTSKSVNCNQQSKTEATATASSSSGAIPKIKTTTTATRPKEIASFDAKVRALKRIIHNASLTKYHRYNLRFMLENDIDPVVFTDLLLKLFKDFYNELHDNHWCDMEEIWLHFVPYIVYDNSNLLQLNDSKEKNRMVDFYGNFNKRKINTNDKSSGRQISVTDVVINNKTSVKKDSKRSCLTDVPTTWRLPANVKEIFLSVADYMHIVGILVQHKNLFIHFSLLIFFFKIAPFYTQLDQFILFFQLLIVMMGDSHFKQKKMCESL